MHKLPSIWIVLASTSLLFSVKSRVAAFVVPPNPMPLINFSEANQQGWSVAIDGDLAVVGSPAGAGYAYVYDTSTGQLLHSLQGSDTQPNQMFGSSVAIDGNIVIVGAQQHQAAYLFDATTGQQLHRLQPTDPSYLFGFGFSVDVSGDLAVVGAPFGGTGPYPNNDVGSAFIFDVKTGKQIRRFDGSSSFIDDFGQAVAIEGTTVVISAPETFTRGSVHVYDALTGKSKWDYGFPEGNAFDPFGKDVAIDGDYIAVAAGRGLYDMPQVLIFDRESGEVISRASTSLGIENEQYKRQMDFSAGKLLVGSWGTYQNEVGYNTGNAALFDAFTGELLEIFGLEDGQTQDAFGFSVAIDHNSVLIGAPGIQLGRGGAYLYRVPEPSAAASLGAAMIAALGFRSGLRRSER